MSSSGENIKAGYANKSTHFNKDPIMSLTYGNLVRGIHLFLFAASSILCLFKPSEHAVIVALLNLAGLLMFELISNSKRPEAPDHSKELAELKEENAKLKKDFQVIKDNISIASASSIIQRR